MTLADKYPALAVGLNQIPADGLRRGLERCAMYRLLIREDLTNA